MSNVSKAREVCEAVVMTALALEPEITLAALKGVSADRFKAAGNARLIEKYRALSGPSLAIARLAYLALLQGGAKRSDQNPFAGNQAYGSAVEAVDAAAVRIQQASKHPSAGLLHRAIAAIAAGEESAMWSARWSGAGIAFMQPVVGQEV